MVKILDKAIEKIDAIAGNVKKKPTDTAGQQKPLTTNDTELDTTRKIARKYQSLYEIINETKNKLSNLETIKGEIKEKRYKELFDEHNSFLEKTKAMLAETLKVIDNKLEVWLNEITSIEKKLSETQNHIAQEEKLHQIGAISEEEYKKKITPLKSNEKRYSEEYISKGTHIKILSGAKKNPIPIETEPGDTGKGDGNTPEPIPPPIFYKNPSIATLLSFFWAGSGQIYNGEIGKGVVFIIVYFFSLLLMFVLVGFVTTPILWIWAMIDANKSAHTINKQLAKQAS